MFYEYCDSCEDRTMDEDGVCSSCIERADHLYEVLGSNCLHELPANTCAICLGRWDHDVRSAVTGKVRSSREYIPWFVPSAAGHGGRGWSDHVGVKQGNGSPSSRSCPTPPALPASVTPSADLEVVGPPAWYRSLYRNQPTIRERVVAAERMGLDWYNLAEIHAADILAAIEPAGEIWPVVTVEPLPAYRATRTDWVAWRQARQTIPIT